ncbi:hypothetical protein GT370_14585 [Acidocella sp. MX-AZ03]|uniref:hypothetical protein n=1 Tax=Acidocella sp. MX-AZ03 TaxID=2697363 RepID=UPI0022DDE364|nr:hypothetical protein [Acidocella sp. MX-AZ03]WBO58410.1 hypothetical protein GT370_14585 [Acidocella sp. MX-AZ03]
MLSVVEQVFGIAPGRGVLQRPAPLPLSRALDRISCIDAAEYNFWYGELYAAATGRKQPSPATITSFGSVSIDPTLLQQIAGPPPIHHHKAPAALYQSKSAQAKLPAIGKHQDLPEIERRLHAQAQKQLDIQDKQAAYDNQRQIIQAIAPWIGFYATLFNTSTIPRISAFLGNAGEESWAFTRLVEDLEYTSASSIARTFGIQSTKAAEPYVNNPEALANYVYSGERARFLGNGPFGNGNGWRYRGRGLLQITGYITILNSQRVCRSIL